MFDCMCSKQSIGQKMGDKSCSTKKFDKKCATKMFNKRCSTKNVPQEMFEYKATCSVNKLQIQSYWLITMIKIKEITDNLFLQFCCDQQVLISLWLFKQKPVIEQVKTRKPIFNTETNFNQSQCNKFSN